MNLELSPEQLLTLIESLHLTEHIRGGAAELEATLLKCAHESGLTHAVAKEGDKFVLGRMMKRALHDELDRYEDGVFWSALADELAARDLRFVKSQEEIDALTDEEYDRLVDGQGRRYEAEFAEHGADHLTLAHPLPLQ